MTKIRVDLNRDPVSSDERASDLVPKIITIAWIRRLMFFVAVAILSSWLTSNFSVAWMSCQPWLGYLEASEQSQSDGKPDLETGLTEPWNRIQPKRELEYHDCFNGFQCARLDLPMDWNSTDPNGPRVNLAIAKLPARVPVTDARYGGLLYLQIGGLGSSGVGFVLNHGKTVQMLVDSNLDISDIEHNKSDSPKYYDVLGMDPRGVNNTMPRISCFPTIASRKIWALQSDAQGIINSSDSAFANMWARYKALGEGCSERLKHSNLPESEIAFHMNTAPFVRDIVEVIEQHGRWREEQALSSVLRPRDDWTEESKQEAFAMKNRSKWREGEERILFWGLSYGTIVGTTFAAMQPHRVERAILDGVVDTPDYYRGEWLKNLQDTDTILDSFCDYCDAAGPEKCALYTFGGKDKIKERFKHIVEALRRNPIGVPAHGALAPDLITYSDLRSRIARAVYTPLQYWSSLAELLVDLEYRNGSSLAMLKQHEQQVLTPPPECLDALPYTPSCAIPPGISLEETLIAVSCTDGNSTYGMSRDEFVEYAAKLRNQSWLIGEWWAPVRLSCVAWDIKPTWRFPGPFAGDTAHPMMFIGNTRDPVTPIRNAHTMSALFPGSAVLATEGEGHCVFTAPSLCMAKHVREYFQTGRLPAKDTVCEANEKAFLGITDPGDHADRKLLEQLRWSGSHLFA